MPDSTPLSAAILVCESVLSEVTGGVSAIRIMDVLYCGTLLRSARFFTLTYLHSRPNEFRQHVLQIKMIGRGSDGKTFVAASAPEQRFVYGYKIDPNGPGAFVLTTEFTLDLSNMGNLGTYMIQAFLDGEIVAETPLRLLWRS